MANGWHTWRFISSVRRFSGRSQTLAIVKCFTTCSRQFRCFRAFTNCIRGDRHQVASWDTPGRRVCRQSLPGARLGSSVSIVNTRFTRRRRHTDRTNTDALGGYRQQNHEPYGLELSLLASIVLGGSSIPRALRLRKPVPLVLSVLATAGILLFGNEFYHIA